MSAESDTFLAFVEQYRAKMNPGARARSRKAAPVQWLYPWAVEEAYTKRILAMLAPIIRDVNAAVSQYIAAAVRGDSRHADAVPGYSTQLIVDMSNKSATLYLPEPTMKDGEVFYDTAYVRHVAPVAETADAVNDFNGKQWAKMSTSISGYAYTLNDAWWPTVKKAWSEANYKLIKTIAQQYIGNVNDIIHNGVLAGAHPLDLTEKIQQYGVNYPRWRAKLIARDQVGKLNSITTQARQTAAGVDWYTWMTAQDERVRGKPGGKYPLAIPSHWDMDGVLCKWIDASVMSIDGGETWVPRRANMPKSHPGIEIQCRCTASPYWEPLLRKVDAKLGDKVKPKKVAPPKEPVDKTPSFMKDIFGNLENTEEARKDALKKMPPHLRTLFSQWDNWTASASYGTHVPGANSIWDSIEESGKLHNQFITKSSRGTLSGEYRNEWETRMTASAKMSYDDRCMAGVRARKAGDDLVVTTETGDRVIVPAVDRPKYGVVMGNGYLINMPAAPYGEIIVRYKDSVQSRMTLAFGNTSNTAWAFGSKNPTLGWKNSSLNDRMRDCIAVDIYAECHVWGELSLADDVADIIVDPVVAKMIQEGSARYASLVRVAKKYSLPIRSYSKRTGEIGDAIQ